MSDAVPIGEVEGALKRIRGITATRIVADADGAIDEIHVLAQVGRPAKQVVRDVESLLIASFGIEVDHRKISVAQVEVGRDEGGSQLRPVLESVSFQRSGKRIEVRVSLSYRGTAYEGVAVGMNTHRARLWSAAQAAVEALESYLEDGCHLILEELIPLELNPWQGYLAALTYFCAGETDELLGTALVQESDVDGAIKAVLDAVNRRVRAQM